MTHRIVLLLLAGAAASGCDRDRSFLYGGAVDGVPGVVDLGELPIVAGGLEAIRDNVVYGEVGATGSLDRSGVTFEFTGPEDGDGQVCVWMDVETVFWNQLVSRTAGGPFAEPDNVYDDGDLDLTGGLSVYYTGTPGDVIGDFFVRYEDALDNEVAVELLECRSFSDFDPNRFSNAGKGAPEFCTVQTIPGVTYLMKMETWSLPIDDDRIGYGVVVVDRPCDDLQSAMQAQFRVPGNAQAPVGTEECLILGESIFPEPGREANAVLFADDPARRRELPSPTWLGIDNVPAWENVIDFEQFFCSNTMQEYCAQERRDNPDCSWERNAAGEGGTRCFCGDPADAPDGGSF